MNIIPKISIILPTFNGEKWIRKSILSVLAQSEVDWELLVIDDGSNNNTGNIVNDFTKSDSRIKYIKNEVNLGIQKTLNKGLKEAKGIYIARIDDDDEWIDVDKLKKQIEFFNENIDYVLVGTGVIITDENGKELSRFIMPENDNDIRNKILSKNCFIHSSVMLRKDVVLKINGYDESEKTRHIEDYDLWLKLGTVGKFVNLNTYSVSLIQRENTISNINRITQARKSIYEIIKFRNKYSHFLVGLFIGYMRLFFALIQRVIPVNSHILYKIKTFYKQY